MSRVPVRLVFLTLPFILLTSGFALARDLSFEQRVAAQEAIERVYYSHQIGATIPFEEAVPNTLLANKVRTYLKQTVALEHFWHNPITTQLLQGEVDRIARETRMPERLGEIYAALNDDPFIIAECFARPTLVDRLSRELFSMDGNIHAGKRAEAEALRQQLMNGEIDIFASDPRRFVQDSPANSRISSGPNRGKEDYVPSGSEFSQASPTAEEREAFVVRVAMPENGSRKRAAIYRIPKLTWDSWWEANQDDFDEMTVTAQDEFPVTPPAPGRSQLESAPVCIPADTWFGETSTSNAPSPRSLHAAIWTGNLMIVWGGEGVFESAINTGGRYNPLTNTWSPTTTFNAPTARREQASVWTGTLMVIWGGHNGFGLNFNTGSRYDPIADRWMATSTSDAPYARRRLPAVWTGTKMIVWGGFPSVDSSGGQYDPVSDSWTPTSKVGAPTQRSDHTVVWTGSRMIVWGGSSAYPVNTGGRYDPSADVWEPTSTLSAPLPRLLHQAVWSGTEMIIWGGQGMNMGPLNTGGRYNPITDSWSPTSVVNAPGRRLLHTALWTGQEMIVWGGVFLTTSPPLNSGGRYNPSNDDWTTTSQVNPPVARREHSAVWAGNEMIIWGGGGTGFSGTNSGARYAPYPLIPPPVAHAGSDVVVECSSSQGTPVTLEGTAESCTDLDQLSFRWSGPFPEDGGTLQGRTPTVTLPLGSSEITLEVEDAQGQKSKDSLVAVVHDTTPPSLTCPSPAGIECQSQYGTLVAVPPASVSDTCDSVPVTVNTHGPGGADASGSYPLGQTEVEMTSMDASGNTTSCAFPVTVVDTTPPHISLVPGTSLLWPPNHRMVDVAADISVTDACTSTTVILSSIISSETDDAPGTGDGNTSNDIQGADFGTTDTSFQLRAERDGNGTGRSYSAIYTAVDSSGNASQAHALVTVPHDMGGSVEPIELSVQESLAGTFLSWNAVSGATGYSVIRGSASNLLLAGDFIDLGTVACVRTGSSQTTTSGQEDGEIPALGEVFFYLASYNDGRDSGYGSASAAKPRISTAGGCE